MPISGMRSPAFSMRRSPDDAARYELCVAQGDGQKVIRREERAEALRVRAVSMIVVLARQWHGLDGPGGPPEDTP